MVRHADAITEPGEKQLKFKFLSPFVFDSNFIYLITPLIQWPIYLFCLRDCYPTKVTKNDFLINERVLYYPERIRKHRA